MIIYRYYPFVLLAVLVGLAFVLLRFILDQYNNYGASVGLVLHFLVSLVVVFFIFCLDFVWVRFCSGSGVIYLYRWSFRSLIICAEEVHCPVVFYVEKKIVNRQAKARIVIVGAGNLMALTKLYPMEYSKACRVVEELNAKIKM